MTQYGYRDIVAANEAVTIFFFMQAKRVAFSAVVSMLILCGAGCIVAPVLPQQRPLAHSDGVRAEPLKPAALKQSGEPWHSVADGVEKTVIVDKTSNVGVVLFRFASGDFSARLVSSPQSPKSVTDWAKTVDGESMVVNGTYFNVDNSPSGFVAVGGKRVGTRKFDLDKSGLLLFTPDLRIVDTRQEKTELDAAKLSNAAQSYPFYVVGGQPAISQDSGQTSRRSFIGQDQEGRTYVGAVSDDFVSLYELMRVLTDTGIDWKNVLNLDGGPSTGIVSSFGGTTDAYDSFDVVPNVIVVTRKTR